MMDPPGWVFEYDNVLTVPLNSNSILLTGLFEGTFNSIWEPTLYVSYLRYTTPGWPNRKHRPSYCWGLPFLVAMQTSGIVEESSSAWNVFHFPLPSNDFQVTFNSRRWTKSTNPLNLNNSLLFWNIQFPASGEQFCTRYRLLPAELTGLSLFITTVP
jgi:hypothetical protein